MAMGAKRSGRAGLHGLVAGGSQRLITAASDLRAALWRPAIMAASYSAIMEVSNLRAAPPVAANPGGYLP